MKPEIVQISKIWNEITYRFTWHVTLEFKEIPDLKVGECEVIQK